MAKVLAVFGATGQQGGSVLNFVANDPELSSQYTIRAITRDAGSEKARALEKVSEVVSADILDRASLEKALDGVNAAFIMTAPFFGPNAIADEVNAVKTIADVAVEKGVEFLIYSTLPPVAKISGGKYTAVTAFDAKAEAAEYIRTLPVRSAFFCPASFIENWDPSVTQAPAKQADGTWLVTRPHPSSTRWAVIAAVADAGKFVGAMLAEPAKFEGKTISAAVALYSWDDIIASFSKATGKQFVFKQVPVEEFRASAPFAADMFTEAFQYYAEYGYYGPETERLVAEGAKTARGELTTLDDWLAENAHVFD